MKTQIRIISFGLAGHIEESKNCTLSGYDRPEIWKPRADSEYSKAVVIDKRALLESSPSLAYLSPMADCGLIGEDVSLCPTPSAMLERAIAPSSYGGMLSLHKAVTSATKEPGPLDSISPEAFAKWWRDKGARMGAVREDGRIVWSDGTVQPLKLWPKERAHAIGLTCHPVNDGWTQGMELKRADGTLAWRGSEWGMDAWLNSQDAPKFV